MKQLLLSKLPALFAALAAEQKLYIPADDAAGQANFTLWREGLQLTKKPLPHSRLLLPHRPSATRLTSCVQKAKPAVPNWKANSRS